MGIKKQACNPHACFDFIAVFGLYVSLGTHSFCNLDEATDVGSFYVVNLVAILTEFNAGIMDVFHDLGQFLVNFFCSPAVTHGVLAHFQT